MQLALQLDSALRERDFVWDDGAATAVAEARAAERRADDQDALALVIKQGAVASDSPMLGGLMPHQRIAAEFLAARDGALLCDEQGLGKTLSALAAFGLCVERGLADRLVVVCPNSLKAMWAREVASRFPTWQVSLAEGTKPHRRRAFGTEALVYLTNYEAVRSDKADLRLLLGRARSVLVCDESHAAKNPDSQTLRALEFVRGAAAKAWIMSGTPVTNHLTDCYAQVTLADQGRLLGSRAAFESVYGQRDDAAAAQELQGRLAPILLRRTKDDVLDLPTRTFEDRAVDLVGRQAAMYESVRHGIFDDVSKMSDEDFHMNSATILTRLLRLSQIASNPRLVDPGYSDTPAKFLELDALLEDLVVENNRKVVLWSYYVDNLREFLVRYDRYGPVAIYGEIPLPERQAAVERFQQDESVRLFIGNPQAAGTGLTLTAAHHAIYETVTWRYDLYAQSLDRVHRIGQDKNVTYHRILAEGTIDEAIAASLERKGDLAAGVLGDHADPKLSRREVLAMTAATRRDVFAFQDLDLGGNQDG